MMTISDPNSFFLLVVSNALLLAAASLAVLRFEHMVRTSQQFWSSPTGSSLHEQQSATEASPGQSNVEINRDLEQRVASLQLLVEQLAEKDRVHRVPVTSNLPIENAARMARHGASVAEITKSCGLNIGEAQLMKKMHGQAVSA